MEKKSFWPLAGLCVHRLLVKLFSIGCRPIAQLKRFYPWTLRIAAGSQGGKFTNFKLAYRTAGPVDAARPHDGRPKLDGTPFFCGTFSGPWMVNRKMQGTFSREKKSGSTSKREDLHSTFVRICSVTLRMCHLMTFLSINNVEQNGHATREADNMSFEFFRSDKSDLVLTLKPAEISRNFKPAWHSSFNSESKFGYLRQHAACRVWLFEDTRNSWVQSNLGRFFKQFCSIWSERPTSWLTTPKGVV